MATATSHVEGAPCWFELGTIDPQAAKRFYSELFAWTWRDSPMPQGGAYTMFYKDGNSVGGGYELMADMVAQGIPSHWMVYFKTDDIEATVRKATENGGVLIHAPFDVMEHGRMAICTDPTGATFSLWQPKQHPGAMAVRTPGAVCWSELATRDIHAAEKFYKSIFGWSTKPSSGMPYIEFSAGGEWLGGILQMDEAFEGMPPYWGIYFSVDDCDRVVERAKSMGGSVKHGPFDAPGVGRIAILADPQNAMFSVIKLSLTT